MRVPSLIEKTSHPGAMTETDYLYDVFFSYKRSPEIRDWTRRVHSKLKFWVGQRMDREPKFFFDEDALELGSTWPDELETGTGGVAMYG